ERFAHSNREASADSIAITRTACGRPRSLRKYFRAWFGFGECENCFQHFRFRSGPQWLDDDRVRAGAFHDATWTGAVLRWARQAKKCAVGPGAMSRSRGLGRDSLVGSRLFARFFTRLANHWRV